MDVVSSSGMGKEYIKSVRELFFVILYFILYGLVLFYI